MNEGWELLLILFVFLLIIMGLSYLRVLKLRKFRSSDIVCKNCPLGICRKRRVATVVFVASLIPVIFIGFFLILAILGHLISLSGEK